MNLYDVILNGYSVKNMQVKVNVPVPTGSCNARQGKTGPVFC